MNTITRLGVVTAAAIAFASAGSAQSTTEATYKAKCGMCHGDEGTPNAGIAKNMGTKAASDPGVRAMTEAQMITITADGKGKMPEFKTKLTTAQIKEVVDYFRGFTK